MLVPMRAILAAADKYRYGQGAFNMNSVGQIEAAVRIHELLHSGAILQGAEASNAFMGGELDFMHGTLEAKKVGAKRIGDAVKKYGADSPVPIALHLDPYTTDYSTYFGAPPSAQHWLGTDDVGRDSFARFISGGQVSLSVGIISAIISLVIGVPLGLIAGYYRGWIETVIMRLSDVFMSFPSMVLILVLVSVLGPSITTVTVVIGILGWPRFARTIYGNVLSVRECEYVEAACAVGTRDGAIMTQYILPNSFAPVLIAFTFRAAQAIITESALSFLGMGVQAPQASWGNILYEAQSISVLATRPWLCRPELRCWLRFCALISWATVSAMRWTPKW